MAVRYRDKWVLALRRSDGRIGLETGAWLFLTRRPWRRQRFLRGVILLAETVYNGFRVLNISRRGEGRRGPAPALVAAMVFFLFGLCPHLLALLFASVTPWPDLGSASFHALDGLTTLALLFSAATMLFALPAMRRLGQYHGAEHKVIRAWEEHRRIDPKSAGRHSLLHPRCGTTLLALTVILAGLLNMLLGPLLLSAPDSLAGHIWAMGLKLALYLPATGVAWELLCCAAVREGTFFAAILTAPGRVLQLQATREPDQGQLEVAATALATALGKNVKEA